MTLVVVFGFVTISPTSNEIVLAAAPAVGVDWAARGFAVANNPRATHAVKSLVFVVACIFIVSSPSAMFVKNTTFFIYGWFI